MNMDDRVLYWIEIAEYDIETARAMLESRRFLYVAFMCHQAIEKMLKAYHQLSTNDMPPKTHNLLSLFDKTGLLVKLDQDQSAFLDILNPLNVQVRYPEYRERILKTLSNERAKEILLKTEELFEWLKRELLKKQGSM